MPTTPSKGITAREQCGLYQKNGTCEGCLVLKKGNCTLSRELGYSYDLLYDIKTKEQLQREVDYLAHRLAGIARLCREDGFSIDTYIKQIFAFPKK